MRDKYTEALINTHRGFLESCVKMPGNLCLGILANDQRTATAPQPPGLDQG